MSSPVIIIDNGSGYTNFPVVTISVCTSQETVPVTSTTSEVVKRIKNCEAGDTKEDFSFKPDIYMFFNDGSMFGIDANQASTYGGCTENNPCHGVIDVNGLKGPNQLITSATNPTDIYPVIYYDQTVRPGTNIASAVLYGK